MKTINLAIVDDQVLFRQGIMALLQQIPEVKVIADAEDGIALLSMLEVMQPLPDILLMDMEMPGMNGIELNRKMREFYPDVKVIMLTLFDQGRYVFKMVEEGVCGYLSKSCNMAELQEAILKVYDSGFFFSDLIKSALQKSSEFRTKQIQSFNRIDIELTNREKEIIQLICHELTNAEIAERLFISARTVEGHRNNLLLKTGSKNTAGLVVFAIKNGIYEIIIS
jgi:DNA-binding NarL/FixJ family response regulator